MVRVVSFGLYNLVFFEFPTRSDVMLYTHNAMEYFLNFKGLGKLNPPSTI